MGVLFKDFLHNEKKRNTFVSFFRISQLVNEAQGKMQVIDKYVLRLILDINVENQIENNKNFDKILNDFESNPLSDFKKRFHNPVAAEIWVNKFITDIQVPWHDFGDYFKQIVLEKEKITLDETDIHKILTVMDTDHDKLIRYDEWDIFYEGIWLNKDRKNLMGTVFIQEESEFEVPQLNLVVSKKSEGPIAFSYPLGHKFFISEKEVVFTDYELKQKTIFKKWSTEQLTFGRISNIKPDIYFHPKMRSVSEKQFQLTLKKFVGDKGFILNNLSSGSPTTLKIETTPYILSSLMLLKVGDTLIEVEKVHPEPIMEEIETNNCSYFLVKVELKEDTGDKPTQIIMRKKKPMKQEQASKVPPQNNVLPFIQFKDLKIVRLTENERKSEIVFKIGSNQSDYIKIDDEQDDALVKIKWDPFLSKWMAFNDDKKRDKSYLSLIGSDELNKKNGEAGKLGVNLRKGMKIAFGGNELEVQML